MPRTPRNPGTGKAPHNGPAANAGKGGDGWGGHPKGASTAKPIDSTADGDAIRALRHDPANVAAKAVLSGAMRQVLFDVATSAREPGPSRVSAADKLLDRIEGKATQRSEMTGRDGAPLEIVRIIVDPVADTNA